MGFVMNVAKYIYVDDRILHAPSEISFLNTVAAMFVIFLLNDLFYAPAHRVLHVKGIYSYIHKHHHRQVLPERGYWDAGNEHPVEQVVGMLCAWYSLQLVPLITGLHAFGALVFFVFYAALAMLNHTRFDVKITIPYGETFLGDSLAKVFRYQVRDHEMHHRFYTCNYAQYFMGWDYLMGTYKPYVSPSPDAQPPSTKV